MAKRTQSDAPTLRQRSAVFFALMTFLPLLLNLFILFQYDLKLSRFVVFVLVGAMVIAGLGFLFLLKTLREITVLAKHFRKLAHGDYHTMKEHNVSNDLEEMAHIGNAFNSVLADLKAHSQLVEQLKKSHGQEVEFLDLVSDVTSEIDLSVLLQRVMGEATRMLNAERATLFLNDEKTDELFSRVAQGDEIGEIRLPNHLGIAGSVFTSGNTVNIAHAYADLRFNPESDTQTAYFTRSILCVPVVNRNGKTIGVTQVLNKLDGPFTEKDELRLKAFAAQVSIGLQNAKLFDDIQCMQNYNESMLESMSNGVITLDEEHTIITCNAAALRIMCVTPEDILRCPAHDFFTDSNAWILEKVRGVDEGHTQEVFMDAELEFAGERLSVNVTVLPLLSHEKKRLGSMIMLEDISNEKRMKLTMSRYMDPTISNQLLEGDKEFLIGKSVEATILFSDVRSFTLLTEAIGAQEAVALLNEYFTIMVECIQQEGGMLDKFIGDAIMAAFGTLMSHDDEEDRAVRTAIAMITHLDAWNVGRTAFGQQPLEIGIGINTDIVISGNIGSPKRMDYTLIGDGVNLAARLESACKYYSTRILISENTKRKLRGTYRLRHVDRVVVKGKTGPVGVYEVLDYHTDETFPNLMDVVGYFRDGMGRYQSGDWTEAIQAFEKALIAHPGDKLSQTYIERCEHLRAHPPEEEWNGVWVMTSK
ncbi:MAG TPA: adenylate/guanylate cyclase domain-containing protein [Nitrospirales bacterium]|nr:adenylate/guanylate cyclase domain-containing protein [Nitrospirales bacterium]HIO21113.1 adenylate/guanylate cyclase domain-containing protein [Nitrospirales bacterium]